MDKKKSQAKTRSQARTVKGSAIKAAGTVMKSVQKTTKKISPTSSTEKKKKIVKALNNKKQTSVSAAKTSEKKNVTSKTAKTVNKAEIKKSLLPAKATKAKQASPPKRVKPIEIKSSTQAKKITGATTKAAQIKKSSSPLTEKKKVIIKKVPLTKTKSLEAKKPTKVTVSEEKPEKPLTKIRKTSGKATAKTIKNSVSVTQEKKQAKKSQPKLVPVKTKTTPRKTLKAESKIEISAEKVGKVVSKNKKVTTIKAIKAVATIENKELQKEKKSSPGKLKVDSRKKTVLKPKEKLETPIATPRKTLQKKDSASGRKIQDQIILTSEKLIEITTEPYREKKPGENASLKIFLPDENLSPEEVHDTPATKLPEEYGENELLLMEVDPSIVFVSWEIKPDDISGETGELTLRVYDVTGMDFDGSHANKFFDIPLRKRVDSKFMDIKMPGRDVIMEIGLLHPGNTFKAIKRSNRVSMPALQNLEEFGISGSFPSADTLIGY